MQAEDMILVSVGDRLVEPPHLFHGLVPARFEDVAPKLITTEDGADVWIFNGTIIPNVGLNPVAGRRTAGYADEPESFERMPPGCFDIDERVKDMNAAGVLASMCFPSFDGLAGRLFAATIDTELALAVIRAYNDWHIDQWCGSYPGRFIPMALPIIWDAELCAQEIRRVAAKGCHSLTFTENPTTFGCPSFHEAFWDPVWRALSDTGVVASVRVGPPGRRPMGVANGPADVVISLRPRNICQAAADLLWSPVIKQFPAVRFALSEGVAGWIPYFFSRLDRTYQAHRLSGGQDDGRKLPSEVFRERFLTCVSADPVGLKLRHDIGIDNIAWEYDYPFSDSAWPTAAEELEEATVDIADDAVDKITFENACKWYGFDPFAHRPRQLSTVGALREEAARHDVSIKSFHKRRFPRKVVFEAREMTSRVNG